MLGEPREASAGLTPETSSEGTPVHTASLRVLLAEDNAINQKVAVRLLARLGYAADIAGDGREVLARLEHATYDVIFMDVQMPELDGLEASRAICARWAAHERPRIIAMTAEAMQGDREKCQAARMIKGTSAMLGGRELSEQCAEIERLGRIGGVTDAATRVTAVEAAYRTIEAALKAEIERLRRSERRE